HKEYHCHAGQHSTAYITVEPTHAVLHGANLSFRKTAPDTRRMQLHRTADAPTTGLCLQAACRLRAGRAKSAVRQNTAYKAAPPARGGQSGVRAAAPGSPARRAGAAPVPASAATGAIAVRRYARLVRLPAIHCWTSPFLPG